MHKQGGVVHNGGVPGGYAVFDASPQAYSAPGVPMHHVGAPYHVNSPPVALHGQWRDNLFDCCGVDGPSSYCMACMFPVCTPCLFAKISSRISFGVAGLSTWGPTTFKQWLRFLSVFAFIYIFCSFNYSIFEHLASEEYYNDVAKSPYNGGAGHYHVQISDETKELYAWAQVFDVGTVLMTTVFCVLLMILRQRVRQRFLIPTMCETRAGENPCCGILEDFACMTFCQACAMAQMARHTLALVGDRCDPYADPGPIEVFPAAHAVAPGFVNTMQPHPQQHFIPHHPQQVPQAYYSPHGTHGAAPAPVGQVVEVGQLVQSNFPAPAASTGVPTATVSQSAARANMFDTGMVDVPMATHVPEPPLGLTRNEAR